VELILFLDPFVNTCLYSFGRFIDMWTICKYRTCVPYVPHATSATNIPHVSSAYLTHVPPTHTICTKSATCPTCPILIICTICPTCPISPISSHMHNMGHMYYMEHMYDMYHKNSRQHCYIHTISRWMMHEIIWLQYWCAIYWCQMYVLHLLAI